MIKSATLDDAVCWGKNRPNLVVFIYLNEDDTHHFPISPNLQPFFIISCLQFHNLWDQIHEGVITSFLLSMCSFCRNLNRTSQTSNDHLRGLKNKKKSSRPLLTCLW